MHVFDSIRKPFSGSTAQARLPKIKKDLDFALLYLKGGTFYINYYLYKEYKDYIDVERYTTIKEGRIFNDEPFENLGDDTALRGFNGANFTTILTQEQIKELILELYRKNPTVARKFLNELIYQARYGMTKTKSY